MINIVENSLFVLKIGMPLFEIIIFEQLCLFLFILRISDEIRMKLN